MLNFNPELIYRQNMSIFSLLIPARPPLKARSLVYDLKARLNWGAPALTIIDVRCREDFNKCHILGAIPMPADELVDHGLVTLELTRDLYIYGDIDEEAAAAAARLRQAGYQNVSELRGGLAAWKAVGYPVEAISVVAA